MKYENVLKHKWLIAVLVLFVIIAIGCKVNNDHKLKAEWESNRQVITVCVGSGDTLDGFGYEYKPSWMDVREYREQVKELNGMRNSTLYEGQELKLYKTEEGIKNAQSSIHD